MSSSLQVVLLLTASLAGPTSSRSWKSQESANVTGRAFNPEEALSDFLIYNTPRNDFMDVYVPHDCLKDNTALFKTFLSSRTRSVTFWTDGELHYRVCATKQCATLRQTLLQIVYLICGRYKHRPIAYSTFTDYFRNYFLVSENAMHPREELRKRKTLPFMPSYNRASGRYVMLFSNGSVIFNDEFERDLIVQPNDTYSRWVTGQRTLSGSSIQLYCKLIYSCEHPSFNVTMELLTHRNASVSVGGLELYFSDGQLLSTFVNILDNRPQRYGYLTHRSLHQFGSLGFSFYVRKRDRVPKETIFILPFSGEVWAGLIGSCLLLLLMYGLIAKVLLGPNVELLYFVLSMLAAFLQQSFELHSSLLTMQSSRLLYGLMALMFVVMSTVFKGRLTSLLNDLPLQGEAARFVSFEEIARRGNRLCFLEGEGFVPAYYTAGFTPNYGDLCFETSNSSLRRSIKISADGRDTFFTYNFPTGPSEALRRELLRRGYVETEGTVFAYPVGPEMRISSAYRHDIDVTLSRGIQAGLYVRSAALAEYKSRSYRERSLESAESLILNLGDLAPFFLALCVGGVISILAFIGEVVVARMVPSSCLEHVRLNVKHPFRFRLKLARERKKRIGKLTGGTR